MVQAEKTSEILLDERHAAWIGGTNTKVEEIVREHLAYGWSADELQEQHSHLNLGQIHAALSYYYDHIQSFEEALKRGDLKYAELRAQTADSALQRRLRALNRNA